MFANAFQSGFISIFYSVGSSPLSIWNKEVKNGHIRRVVDEEVKSLVLEVAGTNVATTYITCPQRPRVSLAIKLPFLVMIIKNMKKYFTFEIQILDDKDIRRRFRVSNFQSTTKVRPFCTTMPIGLSDGWNQVQFNLADFTKRAYGSTYLETVRVQVHANVRIRRIYFSDTLYSEEEMPNEFRLFLPKAVAKAKAKEKGKVEKKAPMKAAPIDKVPSGALPSPVETAAPLEEGPFPTAEIREEMPEVPESEVQPEQQDVAKEAESTIPGENGEISADKEVVVEGGEEAGSKAEPEAIPENEGLSEVEATLSEQLRPQEEAVEVPFTEVDQTDEIVYSESSRVPPADELPAETPPKEE